MKILLSIVLILTFLISSATASEEHWLRDKSDDGSILILSDGSVWQVAPYDQVNTMLWLTTSTIIIPDSEDCLINVDDGEKAEAYRIR